jgi:tRNA (uracil-5-)-methyltransferase
VVRAFRENADQPNNLVYQFPAGSFFQNNSSILVPLTDYVKSQVADLGVAPRPDGGETFLVDAYCGSGLFSLTLASSL